MSAKFYICPHCGNIVTKIKDAKVPVVCCGQKMEELIPNTTDASNEKHVPVVNVEGSKLLVNVGAVDHPMVDEHFIEWVYAETENGGAFKYLQPGSNPQVVFELGDDKPVAVYAWCNLHGLWKTAL